MEHKWIVIDLILKLYYPNKSETRNTRILEKSTCIYKLIPLIKHRVNIFLMLHLKHFSTAVDTGKQGRRDHKCFQY